LTVCQIIIFGTLFYISGQGFSVVQWSKIIYSFFYNEWESMGIGYMEAEMREEAGLDIL
jgi:hypothetical protein